MRVRQQFRFLPSLAVFVAIVSHAPASSAQDLNVDPTPPAPPPEAPTPPPTPVVAASAPAPAAPEASASSGGTQRTFGLLLTIAGLGGVGVSVWMGLGVKSKYGESDSHCVNDVCDSQGLAIRRDAHDRANLATIVGGVGLGVFAGGLLLWATSPSSESSASSTATATIVRTSARLSFTGNSLLFSGRF